MHKPLAPSEIITAYYPKGIQQEKILAGGIVNTTLLITDFAGNRSILQRLSSIFDDTMAEDFDVVSSHLRNEGWEVAGAIKSSSGLSYVPDSEGSLWRSFTFIESDGVIPVADLNSNVALGALLGTLHASLAKLEYTPRFSLPHFHETAFYANKLELLLPELDMSIRELAVKLIEISRNQTISQDSLQLIHGDPKMANALYRDGAPFTFIDFDTLMKANPLVDVGDMISSITGKILVKNSDFDIREILPVVEAYYDKARLAVSKEKFIEQTINAAQVIAIELGIRFLIDTVEDSYFDWDEDRFKTRRDHNVARAKGQWRIYEALRF